MHIPTLVLLAVLGADVPLSVNGVGLTDHSHLFASCSPTEYTANNIPSKLSCRFELMQIMEPKPLSPEQRQAEANDLRSRLLRELKGEEFKKLCASLATVPDKTPGVDRQRELAVGERRSRGGLVTSLREHPRRR